MLDLTRPVAVLFLGVLGHVADTDRARTLVTELMGQLAGGSYLAIADGHEPEPDSGALARAEQDYVDSGAVAYRNRTPAEVASFFTGMDWVQPGFVPMVDWRAGPECQLAQIGSDAAGSGGYGGLARKPAEPGQR